MIYLIILIAGALLSILGPWWIVAAVAFVVCRWKANSNKQAFWQSALAMLSLWLGYALFLHLTADVNLVNKMAGILTGSAQGLGDISNFLLIFGLTGIVSFLIGGLAGFSGYRFKHLNKGMI